MEIVDVPAGAAGVDAVRTAISRLTSDGESIALVPGYSPGVVVRNLRSRLQASIAAGVPDSWQEPALVLPTSGSTAQPKLVTLNRSALIAAAAARDTAQGGPAAWFVALPPGTAAAVSALSRSVLGATLHGSWTGVAGLARFDASVLAEQLSSFLGRAETAGQPARISLVGVQLDRLCAHAAAAAALTRFDAVLLGGGPVAAQVLTRAKDLGIRVVQTYGMTETCGGCVYDGRPTPGVDVQLASDSEILLGGQPLAAGYLDAPMPLTGSGLLRTGDRGRFTPDGSLQVLGRFDDIVTVRGANVDLAAVAEVVRNHPGVRDSAVVAEPAPAGGHSIRAYVVGSADPGRIELRVVEQLGPAARPTIWRLSALPRLPGGKVDLQNLRKDGR